MKIFNHNQRVTALIIWIGALPFLFYAPARASEANAYDSSEVAEKTSGSSRWLDDYSQPVGLTYNAKATINAAYLWRGQYCGALNLQASANVGYGGAYFDMWWNIGTYDWRFESFQPEVDFSLGFNRWGLNVYLLYVRHLDDDCGFFDFTNRLGMGNRLEANLRYTVSSKLPLTIHWATRVAAADGYYPDTIGPIKRAWSSYLELSYTHKFKYDISLYGAVGITPWKSCYTWYVRDFGVVNVELRLRKDWSLSKRCGLMVQGQLAINPTMLAHDPESAKWDPKVPAGQTINANLSMGVYLK